MTTATDHPSIGCRCALEKFERKVATILPNQQSSVRMLKCDMVGPDHRIFFEKQIMPLKTMLLPNKGIQEFPCSSCNSRAERFLGSLNRVDLCLKKPSGRSRLSNSNPDCKLYFKSHSQKRIPCYSIAKLTNYAISSLPVSKLIVSSVLELVVKTIFAQLLDGMKFFRK